MYSEFSTSTRSQGLDLGELLADLGPDTAMPLVATFPDRLVMGTDFYESTDSLLEEPGLLLLAPSCASLSTPELTQLATRAVANRYAAIAVKCGEEAVTRIASISAEVGIPFIRVSEGIGWRFFDAFLSRLLGERGRNEDLVGERGMEPLFALANEVAEVFGGSVAVEDLGRAVIAYSSVPGQAIDALRTQGILHRRVPDSPSNDLQYEEVLRAERPIRYPGSDIEAARVAFPIRAGALPLGSIWAIDATGDGPLTDQQERTMRNAARTAAAYMLEDIRTIRSGQIPREERFRTLLDGHSVVGTELLELGILRDRDCALLVLEPPPGEPLSMLSQLRSTVRRHLALHHPEAVTSVRDQRVYALIAGDVDTATRIAEPLLPLLDRLIARGTRIAAPGATRRATEISHLRDLAHQLLASVPRSAADERLPVLTVERLRPSLVFEHLRPLLLDNAELRIPGLDALANDHPDLAETLLAWCGAFGNVALTARRVGVHENTVRYRLQRTEELLDLRLDDADTRLTAWLQLRVDAHEAARRGANGEGAPDQPRWPSSAGRRV
ncbi:PucR family transcriptional regulator [Leucobacter soli]|uniref:PucR C-terminal helix-turn-helix domain-containing protein n=1 Tax=Leucobacter soli TaxID=2812850 RepID=A0A916NHG6_9MICO|nr:PucR family transcriptional regulator [Leucobacter soli]CAG7614216.1 hypothetical protein LEUCIP111803_01768 [Leucobacter soli]